MSVPDELWQALLRFHREVVSPELTLLHDDVREVKEDLSAFRRETNAHFDAIYARLGRLETEYHALTAAVARLEARMSAVESKLDRMALKSELLDLKAQVARLQERITQLEAEV